MMIIGSITGVILLSGRMDEHLSSSHGAQYDNVFTGALTTFLFVALQESIDAVDYISSNCDLGNLANSLDGGLKGAGCSESVLQVYSFIMAFIGSFFVVSFKTFLVSPAYSMRPSHRGFRLDTTNKN